MSGVDALRLGVVITNGFFWNHNYSAFDARTFMAFAAGSISSSMLPSTRPSTNSPAESPDHFHLSASLRRDPGRPHATLPLP